MHGCPCKLCTIRIIAHLTRLASVAPALPADPTATGTIRIGTPVRIAAIIVAAYHPDYPIIFGHSDRVSRQRLKKSSKTNTVAEITKFGLLRKTFVVLAITSPGIPYPIAFIPEAKPK